MYSRQKGRSDLKMLNHGRQSVDTDLHGEDEQHRSGSVVGLCAVSALSALRIEEGDVVM